MLDVELTAMFTKQFYVYILTNKAQTVLYTGITNDLKKRIWEHNSGLGSKFAGRYGVSRLVYFEVFEDTYEGYFPRETDQSGSKTQEGRSDRKSKPPLAQPRR